MLDYAGASHRRARGLLIVVSLLAFLPGFFQIPPIDRDEARFAQATKQMLETGDYVDIRFQDEVRYKKPVGIYWLQAAVVKAAEALGMPQARTHHLALPHSVADRRDRRGAADLLDGARLRLAPRRAAGGPDDGDLLLLGVEARLAKTDAMLLLTCVAAMGAMARVYLASRRTPDRAVGWTLPAIFWTALAAGMLIKGPLILMFVGLAAMTLSIADRSAAGSGRCGRSPACSGSSAGAALVRRHRRQVRRRVSSPSRSARTCSPRWSAARNPTARRRASISCCSG